MTSLPTGTVTFLLTDVEGSTARWEQDPAAMGAAVERLDQFVANCVESNGGAVVKDRGEGDSHFCVFSGAPAAMAAGIALMTGLDAEIPGMRIRAAIHTGEVELRDGDYYGRTVNRAARLRSAGHGGQLLISEAVAGLVRPELPPEITLRDLGSRRLKDLSSPENVFQVVHPELEDNRTELSTLDQLRSNLPIQLTSLIGRDDEVASVTKLLGEHRLVTLVALGGSGKTRLALQVAADASDGFPSGVRLANLLTISEPDQLGDVVLSALGAPSAGEDAVTAAIDWVASRPILLVLDNCEHLKDGPAELVRRLLGACPELRVLATSRKPLELPGERVFRLSSLGVPGAENIEPAEMTQVPAVRLFVERAQSADSSFSLDWDNAAAVAEICRRLDGLPLALELAAARVKVLDARQILERLERQLEVPIARESGDANRTVLAAIVWSYDQLSPGAAATLRGLSIFGCPVDLDAVERVCSSADTPDVTDSLAELVDNSLLVAETGALGRRYRLLELVRSFGQREMDRNHERDTVERARSEWVRWYLTGESTGVPLDPAVVLSFDGEYDAALKWVEENEPESWIEFALSVASVREYCERPTAALNLARRALGRIDPNDTDARVGALSAIAVYAFGAWEPQEGVAAGLEALKSVQEMGRDESLEFLHNIIGVNAWRAGDLETARIHLERYYELAQARPDGWADAVLAANNLGLAAPDSETASRWFHIQLELDRSHGRGGDALLRLGEVALKDGRIDDAAGLLAQAALERPRNPSSIQMELGRIELLRGNAEAAAVHIASAEQLANPGGRTVVDCRARVGLAGLAHRRGDQATCGRLIDEAVSLIGPEPSMAFQVFRSAMDHWAEAGHPDFSLRLAHRLMDITRRDGSAKHQAVALYQLALAQKDCGLAEAVVTGGRAVEALAAAGDGQVGGHPLSWYRDRLEEMMATFEAPTPTLADL